MSTSPLKARGKAPAPVEANKIDPSTFKTELSPEQIAKLAWPGGGIIVYPFGPIDAITPIKTLGKGRTNLTLTSVSLLQTDAATPYASFNLWGELSNAHPGAQKPGVSIHFEPDAYGITDTASYVINFRIQTNGPATFDLEGYAGAGSVLNAGSKAVNGAQTVQLVLQNVPPSQQTYAYLQQTGGASWSWFSTAIDHPPLLLNPGLAQAP